MTAMTDGVLRRAEPVIDRASPTDRAFLAMDTGQVPEQFGIILLLDQVGELDLSRARRLIAERIQAVPRLRQRLLRTPFGCGGPIWVDDPGFDIRGHVRAVACREPGDEQALLDTALSLIVAPLRRSAPLWSAVVVTGLSDGRVALVVVLHHALADGVGGLAILASLVDAPANAPSACFPRPAPGAARLAEEAWVGRLRGLRYSSQAWDLLRMSTGAGGGLHPPRAAPCSLNRRTGQRRQLAVVRADIATVRAAAHRHGATTNDAILVAVAGALHRVLQTRGESLDTLMVTVPVSGRRAGGGPALGNMVSPMLVSVPASGDAGQRLAQVAAQVRAHKAAATGPPPIAVLGWLFRPLAALGGYHWYMNHQHRFHTLVSHVRGPAERVTFGGSPITSAIPVGVAEGGNVTVYFGVLSYAGTLTLTAIVDPDHFPDLDILTDALRAELDLIIYRRHGGSGRSNSPLEQVAAVSERTRVNSRRAR
jgi:WS/DGAT/MGAT family acyltransferase